MRPVVIYRTIAIAAVGIATGSFCILVLLLGWISDITGNPYSHLLNLLLSNPFGELAWLQSFEIPGSQLAVLTFNLSIVSCVLAVLVVPWHESCFAVFSARSLYRSIKDGTPIALPVFVPMVGIVMILAFGFLLKIAIALDFSYASSIPSNLSYIIELFHLQSLYLSGGVWDGVLTGKTAFYALICLSIGIFVFRMRSGIRVAITDTLIVSSLILVTFELMIFRNVVLGYSPSGMSFMFGNDVITDQPGFVWLTNFNALILGGLVLSGVSVIRSRLH